MVIEYPNVKLLWHNSKRGFCGLLEDIPDITKKRYGYNLEPGQEVYMVGYYTNGHQYCYHVTIKEVSKDGVKISDWMEKGWHTDTMAIFQDETGDAFLPWKYKGEDLYIEPCESLFEPYKVKDLIDGTAPRSRPREMEFKIIPDPRGEGWWYPHGGWRTISKYEKNIKNFVRLGQTTLADFIEEG